jgi:tetratricopeptide (TPR) repeat protein
LPVTTLRLGCALLSLLLAVPSAAQTDAASSLAAMSDLCRPGQPPDVMIGACTILIESGEHAPEMLADIFNRRGIASYGQGAYPQAFEDFQKAVNLMPGRADYHRNLGSARSNLRTNANTTSGVVDHLERSVEDFNRALELSPRDAETISRRGVAYIALGRAERGIADLDLAIELDPDSPRLRATRGNARMNQGAYVRAIEDFDEALRLQPDFIPALFGRGVCHDKLENDAQALADFEAVIRLNPAVANAYNNRGIVLAKRGEMDKALEDFTNAILLAPNMAGAYFNRGQVYSVRGDRNRALADYVQARQLDRQFPPPPGDMFDHYTMDVPN